MAEVFCLVLDVGNRGLLRYTFNYGFSDPVIGRLSKLSSGPISARKPKIVTEYFFSNVRFRIFVSEYISSTFLSFSFPHCAFPNKLSNASSKPLESNFELPFYTLVVNKSLNLEWVKREVMQKPDPERQYHNSENSHGRKSYCRECIQSMRKHRKAQRRRYNSSGLC